MSCEKIDAKQWRVVADRFEREPLFIPVKQAGTVHFRIKVPNDIKSSDTVMMIYSHRLNAAVYRGPIEPNISLLFDEQLLSDKGYDNMDFRLLHKEEVCVWINDHGESYWHPEANVGIDLLPDQTEDENGRPKWFNVAIR